MISNCPYTSTVTPAVTGKGNSYITNLRATLTLHSMEQPSNLTLLFPFALLASETAGHVIRIGT